MSEYDAYFETRKQVVCDDCGKVQLNGLAFRSDFEIPVCLCRKCAQDHDNSLEVREERNFHDAMSGVDE